MKNKDLSAFIIMGLMVAAFLVALFWPRVQPDPAPAPPPANKVAAEIPTPEMMKEVTHNVVPSAGKLQFIVLLDGGRTVLYEVIKGDYEKYRNTIRYTNTEGVERTWNGSWLISEKPFSFNPIGPNGFQSSTIISSPTALNFKAN